MRAATAEITHARRVQRQVGNARNVSSVKSLRLGVEIHAAAFEQHDLERRVREGEGKRDPRGAAADDGKIRLQDRARRDRPGVNKCAQIQISVCPSDLADTV
jgi:hypothetical protein